MEFHVFSTLAMAGAIAGAQTIKGKTMYILHEKQMKVIEL